MVAPSPALRPGWLLARQGYSPALVEKPTDPRAQAPSLTFVASDVAPIGGMERSAFELSRRLIERGWELTVIARSCALPPHPRLRFIRLRSPSRPVSVALVSDLVFGSIALARNRRGLVQTNNPIVLNRVDLIHAHSCERGIRETGISRARRQNLAYKVSFWLATTVSVLLERWNYRPGRVERIVCVAAGQARDIAGFYPQISDRLLTLPIGVDPRLFSSSEDAPHTMRRELGLADDALVALFVGGDWRLKGLGHAIDGIAAAQGWNLVVLGAGDQESFSAHAESQGVADRVHFMGKVGDPVPYYHGADAFIAPSYFEAFSLATHEAAAAGLPLLPARLSSSEELVQDGVNGWFIERDGAAIGQRLAQLGEDAALRARMGEAARESARRFDWERVVDDFEALYAEFSMPAGPPSPGDGRSAIGAVSN